LYEPISVSGGFVVSVVLELVVCVELGLVVCVAPGLVVSVAPLPSARIIGACDDRNLVNARCAAIACACCPALALSVPGAKPVNIVADKATTIITATDVPIVFLIRVSSRSSWG
jgi:hypothetical protein